MNINSSINRSLEKENRAYHEDSRCDICTTDLAVRRGTWTTVDKLGETPAGGSLCISLADFRMICQTEVVVEAPAEDILSVEFHMRSQLTLKSWECKISFCFFAVLSYRTARRLSYSVKNICVHIGSGFKLFFDLLLHY